MNQLMFENFDFDTLQELMETLYGAEAALEEFQAELKAYERGVESAKKAIFDFLQRKV